MADSRVVFDIVATDKASGAFGSAGRGADDLGSKTSEMGRKAAAAFAVGAAAAGVFAVKLGKDAVGAASNMQETLSKSNTVFGSSAGDIEKWSKSAARSFGQSQQGALEAAGTFGNLFVQLGVGAAEAAKMSKAQTELASDFASFHNTSPEEAVEAMTAAYRGEYDAVQRFVPTINAAAVEQRALEMGLAGTTKELTAQDKALATQALLLEGAGAAAGDFDRTNDGLANKQRILSAVWADAQVQLGNKLLPVVSTVTGFFADNLPTALDFAGRAFSRIKDAVTPIIGIAKQVFDILFKGDFTGGPLAEDSPFVAGLFTVRDTIGDLASKIKDFVMPIFDTVSNFVRDNMTPILAGFGTVLAYLAGSAVIGAVISAVTLLAGILASPVVVIGALIAAVYTAYTRFEAFRDVVANVISFFTNEVVPRVKEVADAFGEGGLGAAFSKVQEILSNALPVIVEKLGEWGSAFVDWVAKVAPPLLEKLGELLVAVGGWIFGTALPAIIDQLADWAAAFVDWVAPKIVPLLTVLADLLLQVGTWMKDVALPAIIEKLSEWASAFVDWVGPQIVPLLIELGRLLVDVAQWVKDVALPEILRKLAEWGAAFVAWVAPKVLLLIGALALLLGAVVYWMVTEALPALLREIGKWAATFVDWVADAALEMPGKLLDFITDVVKWLTDEGIPKLVDIGKKMGSALVNWIITEVKKIPERIVEAVASMGGALVDAGKSLGSKISEGLGSALSTVTFGLVGDGPGRPPGGMQGGNALARVQSALTAGTYVTSTYRSPADNARVGGSPRSYHLDRANPAVDIGGSTSALNVLAGKLRAMGGWRELLWQVRGHYDHIHAAHTGGYVTPQGIAPLRSDELLTKLQTGETVLPRGSQSQSFDPVAMGRVVADVAEAILRQRMRAA